MLFLNAIPETRTQQEDLDSSVSEMVQLTPYFPHTQHIFDPQQILNPDLFNILDARLMFWNFDGLWERFMNACQLREAAARSGLRMKSENSIVDMWPLRLKRNPTQEEVSRLHASPHTGGERYVELTRMA